MAAARFRARLSYPFRSSWVSAKNWGSVTNRPATPKSRSRTESSWPRIAFKSRMSALVRSSDSVSPSAMCDECVVKSP